MRKHTLIGAMIALPLCAGCALPPERTSDADYYAPKTYRTGSNLPVKDYGADRVDDGAPYLANPANRPLPCSTPKGVIGC